MIDVISALIVFLKENYKVKELAGEKIFGDELPSEEIENMPQKCVVIMESGGIERRGYLPLSDPRIDIYCYGETYFEAGKLDRAIYEALKNMIRETTNNTLLHGATLSSGALSMRDKDTGWRMKMRSATVSIDDRGV